MAWSATDRSAFQLLYVLKFSQRMAEHKEYANWRFVGEQIGRAENIACKAAGAGLTYPGACSALQKYTDKSQKPNAIINSQEIGQIAESALAQVPSAQRSAASSGYWFGYAYATCLQLVKGQAPLALRQELLTHIKTGFDNLRLTGVDVDKYWKPIIDEFNKEKVNYGAVKQRLDVLNSAFGG